MKNLALLLLLIFPLIGQAQVGIGTATPHAQLEIKSSNEATPAITDGLLIPKVNNFPATNPTVAQQGMLVYLKNVSGTNQPGFYYWDFGTLTWLPIGNSNSSGWNITGNSGIDDSVNFIGTTDDASIVFKRNNIPAGFLGALNTAFGVNSLNPSATGTLNTAIGLSALSSNTTGYQNTATGRMTLRDNTSGFRNTAFGISTLLSNTTGFDNTATGSFSLIANTTGTSNTATGRSALGSNRTGYGNTANGHLSLLNNDVGEENTANGISSLFSNTTGSRNTANGRTSLATNITGNENSALGYVSNVALNNLNNATAIGARAEVGASNSLVLGSISGVNGATASVNVGIGTQIPLDKLHVVGNIRMVDGNQAAGNVLTSDANGTATWTNPIGITNGTLDQAYDFGGAGLGKTITADAGAVLINGTDGLVSTGTFGSGAFAPTGIGTRMVWNPRKGAFRAGGTISTGWDDVNIGIYSAALGYNLRASGQYSVAFGNSNLVTGNYAISAGSANIASGTYAAAFGFSNDVSGSLAVAFGIGNNVSGDRASALGGYNQALGNYSNALGSGNNTFGQSSTAFGVGNIADGSASVSMGIGNVAESFAETVIGVGATNYASTPNGSTQFRTANATDRLFVVGNAIDANNNDFIDTAERSDALVILKNGNTGIGTSTPTRKLHIQDNSTSTTAGQLFLEQSGSGDALIHIGNTGGRHFNLGLDTSDDSFKIGTSATSPTAVSTGTLMKIQATGEVGIGTVTPDRKLEVSGTGIQYARITSTSTTAVGLELKRNGSDWQMRNDGGDLIFAQSNDDLATVTDVVRVGGGSFTAVTDNAIPLGQNTRRWLSVHATNGVIQTSDANDKKQMLPLTSGLDKIKNLRPISFQWKDNSIDNASIHLGFVAQEVQQTLPEVVVDYDWVELPEGQGKVWKKTERLGMKYAEIIPVLVKAMQEQQTIIEAQKTQLDTQEKTIAEILARLKTITNKN